MLDHGGVVGRTVPVQYPRPAGGRAALDADQVLDRDGNPGEGAEWLAAGALGIDRCRLSQRLVGIDTDEGIDRGLSLIDRFQGSAGDLDGARLA